VSLLVALFSIAPSPRWTFTLSGRYNFATVRIRDRYAGQEAVTCVIPGHDRDGEELVAAELQVNDAPLAFDYSGTCGYAATFAYSGR